MEAEEQDPMSDFATKQCVLLPWQLTNWGQHEHLYDMCVGSATEVLHDIVQGSEGRA